mgnify:CR=1 FL=1
MSRRLAQALGLRYVDTGAMYRVVGVLRRHERASTSPTSRRWRRCATGSTLRFDEQPDGVLHVLANGARSDARHPHRGGRAARLEGIDPCRWCASGWWRCSAAWARAAGWSWKGATSAPSCCPSATVKIYLVASAEERGAAPLRRAHRRGASGRSRRISSREIEERDVRDRTRARHSPLRAGGRCCADRHDRRGASTRSWARVHNLLAVHEGTLESTDHQGYER